MRIDENSGEVWAGGFEKIRASSSGASASNTSGQRYCLSKEMMVLRTFHHMRVFFLSFFSNG